MSVVHTNRNVSNFSTLLVTLMMLFSSIIVTDLVINAEASASGDLSIVGTNPTHNDYIPAYEATYFEVTVSNLDSFTSPVRAIEWYVCLGERVNNVCISSRIDEGSISITSILPGETLTFTSNDPFFPSGLNETITVVYQFEQFDFNPTNDVANFLLNVSLEFTDVIVDDNENIINQLSDLASYNGEDILSNNTGYNLTFTGYANICFSCHLNATVGWQLWDLNKSEMISELYFHRENFPKFSFYKSFSMDLPTFSHDADGVFTLVYGIFNSTGNPFGDLYESNNLASVQLIIDTEFDVTIENIFPSHNPSAINYLYGNNMVTVQVSNNGNMTAEDLKLELHISKANNLLKQTCEISILIPNQQRNCVFDMNLEGESITIKAILEDFNKNNQDINPLDNELEESSNVIVSQLSSSIEIENQKEWYTDNEVVTVGANVNPLAPSPINFSWWYSGIINIHYGQELDINTADYGLGNHDFKLISSDSLGNSETVYFSILIYAEIEISEPPMYQASAITSGDNVAITHQTSLPKVREDYNIGGGNSPLLLLQFNLVNTETNESLFDGQNWMDIELSIFDLVPSDVPLPSIDIRKLGSMEDTNWDYFNSEQYGLLNQNTMSIRIYEGTTILIVGELSEPNIEALNFSVDLISGGNFELSWSPSGETESDYILGWNIHQKIVPEFGGTIFPSPQQNYDENLWDDLILDSFRSFVPLEETSWQDLISVPDGFCASYAILPVDRTGDTYNHLANVSMDNGTAAFVCGDSTPPSTSIINMQNSWRFTNDTACYDILKDWNLCYEVTISWTWPEGEVDETWDLYRVEQNPNGMDLKLLQPTLSDISYVAGESFQFTQNGIDDDSIRPMKTYYYILTPTDQYGNERTVAIYPSANVERVHIENDWWAYNQHIIPEPEPEPEPPLNSEWLGNFSDSLDQQEFQTAGIVTLVTLCLGVIMLAFISKRLKRLKRVIGARNRRLAANSMADEFDEFFE